MDSYLVQSECRMLQFRVWSRASSCLWGFNRIGPGTGSVLVRPGSPPHASWLKPGFSLLTLVQNQTSRFCSRFRRFPGEMNLRGTDRCSPLADSRFTQIGSSKRPVFLLPVPHDLLSFSCFLLSASGSVSKLHSQSRTLAPAAPHNDRWKRDGEKCRD